MRVNSEGNWAFASRDLFKAELCEHCVRLSMAVKAGLPDVVAKVEPYIEVLSQKLPIIQGNQRERIVFDEIKASLPEGDFVELDSANPDETVALMKKSVQAGQLESMVLLAKWQLAGVEGTEHDPFEAQQMLKTAAQTGNAEALFELGKLYFDDLGNKAKGLEYLQQAADKQHRAAQIFIQVATSIAPAIKMP